MSMFNVQGPRSDRPPSSVSGAGAQERSIAGRRSLSPEPRFATDVARHSMATFGYSVTRGEPQITLPRKMLSNTRARLMSLRPDSNLKASVKAPRLSANIMFNGVSGLFWSFGGRLAIFMVTTSCTSGPLYFVLKKQHNLFARSNGEPAFWGSEAQRHVHGNAPAPGLFDTSLRRIGAPYEDFLSCA
jgi:hypothetical protein